MTELSRRRPAGRRPHLLGVPRPGPRRLVARLQAAAALAASDTDLDIELMVLVERTDGAGRRARRLHTAYTLRFVHDDIDLLLRVAVDGDAPRGSTAGWSRPSR